jgi:hypothetical protein
MAMSKAIVVIPFILLLAAVVVAQTVQTGRLPGRFADIAQMPITYAHNRWEGLLLMLKNYMVSRAAQGLQLMGYNFDKDLTQTSVTLWYKGGAPLSVSAVSFDGVPLKPGLSGAARLTSTNEMIFASAGAWNLDTGGSSSVVQPNTILTLYLGVSSVSAGMSHSLQMTAGGQTYTFALES